MKATEIASQAFPELNHIHNQRQQAAAPNKTYWYAIIMIVMVYLGYHGWISYQEESERQEIELEKGLQCLIEYKAECNPLSPNDKCNDLLSCIQTY